MIPVTYGYARVSKSDRDEKNLDTQLRVLSDYGIRQENICVDVASGKSFVRQGWQTLMDRIQPNDSIVVVWLDRLSRSFEEGVQVQAELTERNIGIVAISDGIDTSDGSAAAKMFRRMMMVSAAYQRETTSERIIVGQARARADGKRIGRPPALTPEQVGVCRRLLESGASRASVARVMGCASGTIKRAVLAAVDC